MGYSAKLLTDSPFRVSLASVAYFTPIFLLALSSGVIADAMDRKRTVVVCRFVSAVLGVVLAALSFTNALGYSALLVLAFLTGATVVFEVASRMAFVTQVVKPEQAAGYLFFAAMNAYCVWVFLRIKASGAPSRAPGHPVAELVAGLRYLRRSPDALVVVTVSIASGTVGWLYIALLPSVNHDVLHGGAVQLAVLSAAIGIGSVPPSLLLALRAGSPPYEGLMF